MTRHSITALAAALAVAYATAASCRPAPSAEPLDAETLAQIKVQYRRLIDAENRHDLDAVRRMVWDSPSALFVAKTATQAEGGWAGFWGKEVVLQHLHDIYQGVFVMAPDYDKEKVVGLSHDVAQTYVPLNITVAYAGQSGAARPFLMIVEWVRTPGGWKMASDIAVPVPMDPPAR